MGRGVLQAGLVQVLVLLYKDMNNTLFADQKLFFRFFFVVVSIIISGILFAHKNPVEQVTEAL